MKKNMMAAAIPYPDDDHYRAEEDERRLTYAAEVMADRKRLKAALALMNKKSTMVNRLCAMSKKG